MKPTFGLQPVPWVVIAFLVITTSFQLIENWYVEGKLRILESNISTVNGSVQNLRIKEFGTTNEWVIIDGVWKTNVPKITNLTPKAGSTDFHDSTHEVMFKAGVAWAWLAQFRSLPTNISTITELQDYFWARQLEAEKSAKK